MKAILVHTNGKIEAVTPKNGKCFELDELQNFVGGYIEIHATQDGKLIVLNEEGRILGLKPNLQAFALCPIYGALVGNVLICDKAMIK